MTISKNLEALKTSLPEAVTLVAVSKTKSNEAIMEAYALGQRVFGENKVQEMVEKYETLPKDIEWHMIGHLQRNKVKYMASFVHLIHGVDTEKLLAEINKQAARHDRRIPCLLQVHIAEESTKFGFAESELSELITRVDEFPNVEIKGLMGMASFSENINQIQQEFRGLKKRFDQIFKNTEAAVLSMGMSGDYPIAIAEGSTLIRIGSKIFGARNY